MLPVADSPVTTDLGNVVDLALRREPVSYTIHLTHHWDDRLEIWVEGAASDERSRASIADAMRRAAELFDPASGAVLKEVKL